MLRGILPYSILQYIVEEGLATQIEEPVRLPPMNDLAKKLGISQGKLREELVAVEAYGVVKMRPGDGTYVCPFNFHTAIQTLILYAIVCDWRSFDHLYKLRVQLEIGFWEEAVGYLNQEDKERLGQILEQSERKLAGRPVEIPHREHRNLHLLIYSHLDNKFAQGLLKVYWDAYEAVGLHRYFDYDYYEQMWSSHRKIVEAILAGRYQEGKDALTAHLTLLDSRLRGASDETKEPDM